MSKKEVFKVNGVSLERNDTGNFDKYEDVIVLKGRLFKIQSVAPKKIILKYSGQGVPGLPSGVFKIVKVEEPDGK